jgi:hypothetical protein
VNRVSPVLKVPFGFRPTKKVSPLASWLTMSLVPRRSCPNPYDSESSWKYDSPVTSSIRPSASAALICNSWYTTSDSTFVGAAVVPRPMESLSPALSKSERPVIDVSAPNVVQLPLNVRIELRVLRIVALLARGVPIGIGVVDEAPTRHRVVVADDAGVSDSEPRLSGRGQKIGNPIRVLALIIQVRRHVERREVARRSVRFRFRRAQAERHAQVVARLDSELQPADDVFHAAELLRAARHVAVLTQRAACARRRRSVITR